MIIDKENLSYLDAFLVNVSFRFYFFGRDDGVVQQL